MTDIREGVEKFVSKAYWYEGEKNIVVDITAKIFSYLKSEGVVRLADKQKMIMLNKGAKYLQVVNLDGTEL